MYERIFGKYPQVKVLNYVLINPEKSYSKKEIAVGANISRVTLDSFINDLEELNILSKDGLTYYVNINSKVVKALIKTQITLAELIMEDETRDPETLIGEALTDEELDKFLDSFDFEVDIDNELEKIEKGEVSITKQEELKMDDDTIIISSDNLNTDIILTQYIDKGFNKGRINYG
ncbi:hypothetical protein [Methanosphaera sp.]|uniref:hypothetical protein n=1 Tax=Methanosphaera sp. TaxID=2666342 RepID=UPI002E790A1C|nr:hypothetical protein [Methanosphaera sp.]MEE1117832.1 hypothetical protein [Methanosphaera sp.]